MSLESSLFGKIYGGSASEHRVTAAAYDFINDVIVVAVRSDDRIYLYGYIGNVFDELCSKPEAWVSENGYLSGGQILAADLYCIHYINAVIGNLTYKLGRIALHQHISRIASCYDDVAGPARHIGIKLKMTRMKIAVILYRFIAFKGTHNGIYFLLHLDIWNNK